MLMFPYLLNSDFSILRGCDKEHTIAIGCYMLETILNLNENTLLDETY